MKNILKALGITIGFITLTVIVGGLMMLGLDMIQETFELTSMHMVYGIGGTMIIGLFIVVYYVINAKSKEEKKKIKIVEDDIRSKQNTQEINRQKQVLRDKINEWADGFLIDLYLENVGFPVISEDDIVIPNKYKLIKDSGNTWDTGASGLIGYSGTKAPFTCKVTGKRVNLSYAYDQVDNMFNHGTYDFKSDEELIEFFEGYMKKRKEDFTDIYGLYVEIKFETIGIKFQPEWGLNIFSFLPMESEEGKDTFETWEGIYNNDVIRKEFKEKEEALIKKNEKLLTEINYIRN